MNIVMIEDFFHPHAGYQVNILAKYLVSFGNTVSVVAGELDLFPDYLTAFFGKENIEQFDKIYTEQYGVKIIRVPLKRYISGRAIYQNKIYSIVDNLKPDILYVHGNDTWIGMQYIVHQNRVKAPIIFDSHMIEMASKNPLRNFFRAFYKVFITPNLVRHGNIVIRMIDDPFVIKRYGIPEKQAPIVGFGSDLLIFHPDVRVRDEYRKKHKIDADTAVILYAGKLDEAKGGLFLAQSIREKLPCKRKLHFVIVGNVSGEYGAQVEKMFSQSENRIIRKKTQEYINLPPLFQMADLVVFPKQCSLTYYDVLACKVPVLLEDNPIGLKRAKEGGAMCFHGGDMQDFRRKIMEIIEMPREKYDSFATEGLQHVQECYNYETQARKYEKILISVVNSQV